MDWRKAKKEIRTELKDASTFLRVLRDVVRSNPAKEELSTRERDNLMSYADLLQQKAESISNIAEGIAK